MAHRPFKTALRDFRVQKPDTAIPVTAHIPPPLDFPAAVSATLGTIQPLKHTPRVQHTPPPTSPHPRRVSSHHQNAEPALNTPLLHTFDYFDAEHTPEHFVRSGSQQQILQKLRAGHWPIITTLDLHGINRHQAAEKLLTVIHQARQHGRCIRIIHGQGHGSHGQIPVLKPLIRQWLMRHPDVLAFCDCHIGGTGAVRVLLRKRLPSL